MHNNTTNNNDDNNDNNNNHNINKNKGGEEAQGGRARVKQAEEIEGELAMILGSIVDKIVATLGRHSVWC